MIKTTKGELPVYFGMNALARFGDLTDKTMTQVLDTLSDMSSDMSTLKMSDMLAFIYSGFTEGARREKIECQIESVEMIGDMIDDDGDLITKVMTAYSKQSVPEDAVESDGKKK